MMVNSLSLLDSRSDTDPRPFAGDWRELFLAHAPRDKKDGPAFVPATFAPGGRRCTADVEALTLAVFDVDEGAIDVAAVAARLEAAGVEHLIHSSHSHRASKPALRVILPLARPVPPAAWAEAWKRGARLVGPGCSSKSKDPAHLYYLPSCPPDHAGEAIRIYRPGERLDLLAGAPAPSTPAPVAIPAGAPAPADAPLYVLPPPVPWTPAQILLALPQYPDARIVHDGEAFEPGGRDQRVHRLVSEIVFRAQGRPDESSVVDFFRGTIEAMRAASPSDAIPLAKVSDCYRRAVADFVRKRSAQLVEDARMRRALAPALSPVDAAIDSVIRAGTAEAPAGPDPVDPDPEALSPTYSDAEREQLARLAGCSVADLPKRWIIQAGGAYYVLRETGYARPIMHNELAASLPRDLARAGEVSLVAFNKNGAATPRDPKMIVVEHGTVARRVIASLSATHSRYDAPTETFTEAVTPLRPLTPLFDPQIDKWLRILGGQYSEKLLDWVATIADLSRPSCAIYLIGRKGAGKSMLAHGLSRLWSSGGPTSAMQVLGSNFNGGLVDCPLILADEALPARFGARAMSAEIREIIGSSSRPLMRKFLADARIEGSIRLILAANHDRLLSEMMRHEDRSAADIEAVAERFLVVRTPPEAASYLLELGGRDGTAGWVDGDGIARHALWLRRNRIVASGGRWLVSGELADMSDALAVSGSVSGLVVEWLAKAISDPSKIGPVLGDPPGFVVGDGRILVRAGFVSEFWESYIIGQKTPTTHAIGSALASLATIEGDRVRYNTARYRSIRPDAVRAWAVENMICEPEAFDAALRTVLP